MGTNPPTIEPGRASLGISLGTLLPDEKLTSAAKWTGQALVVAERLGDPGLAALALTMHGNEVRKAGHIGAAIARLRRAVERSSEAGAGATACAMLARAARAARAAGEAGQAELFDATMNDYRLRLDRAPDTGMLANEFTFHEIRIRGLVATGRATEAARLMIQPSTQTAPAAPQWAVIERITIGQLLLGMDDPEGAQELLLAGVRGAESSHLPHQAQRAVRIATDGRLDAVIDAGRAAVARLSTLRTDR